MASRRNDSSRGVCHLLVDRSSSAKANNHELWSIAASFPTCMLKQQASPIHSNAFDLVGKVRVYACGIDARWHNPRKICTTAGARRRPIPDAHNGLTGSNANRWHGRTYPATSKIAIIRPSEREDADVDFIFVQVSVDESFVDYHVGCGNISSGVGPFAINEGLMNIKRIRQPDITQEARIYQPLSTKTILGAHGCSYKSPHGASTGLQHVREVARLPILTVYRYTIGGGVDRGPLPRLRSSIRLRAQRGRAP
ncbi:hypothetical protein AC578_7888 [Pseudocercospora eumusae]|uniref:Uncharacterized protein n=1 Tax=Pseudocercospora eumusae TaxID=321146 RepID=A0A139HP55_9PEZI|nr:hypothetical protein AC578_7888 [Pseudocercospora eumusae]